MPRRAVPEAAGPRPIAHLLLVMAAPAPLGASRPGRRRRLRLAFCQRHFTARQQVVRLASGKAAFASAKPAAQQAMGGRVRPGGPPASGPTGRVGRPPATTPSASLTQGDEAPTARRLGGHLSSPSCSRDTSAKWYPGTLPEKEGTHWAATAPFLRTASSAPKGRTMIAQGEALGNGCGPSSALKGRTNHPSNAVG